MTEKMHSLFNLLPEFYRQKDWEADSQLNALLSAIETERSLVAQDIAQMYDNWFAETADEQALATISGLFGKTPGFISRSDVADTIACRRRKGTATAAMRRIETRTGWINKIDVDGAEATAKIWRLQTYSVEFSQAASSGDGWFKLNPFGVDVQVCQQPEPRYDINTPFSPVNAPSELTPSDIAKLKIWRLSRNAAGRVILATQLTPLAMPESKSATEMPAEVNDVVYIDPKNGDVFDTDHDPNNREDIYADYTYSFSGDLGGGPYFEFAENTDTVWSAVVCSTGEPNAKANPACFLTLSAALQAFRQQGGDGLIRILDSSAYDLTANDVVGGEPEECGNTFSPERHLTVTAADGQAPVIRGDMCVAGAANGATVMLCGLWIGASITVKPFAALDLSDCTIRSASTNTALTLAEGAISVSIARSICGQICVSSPRTTIVIQDSILHPGGSEAIAGDAGHVDITRSTILGKLPHEPENDCDNVYVPDILTSAEKQAYFTSLSFGAAEYCQLSKHAPQAYLNGARNGSEKGAFNFLMQPQRLDRLSSVLEDYVPADMLCKIRFVT